MWIYVVSVFVFLRKLGCVILCCFCVFPKTRGSAILQICSGQDKKSLQWELWSGGVVAKIQTICFSFSPLLYINLLVWVKSRVHPTWSPEFKSKDISWLTLFVCVKLFIHNIFGLHYLEIINKTYSLKMDIKGGSGCPYIGAAHCSSLIILTFVGTAPPDSTTYHPSYLGPARLDIRLEGKMTKSWPKKRKHICHGRFSLLTGLIA